MFSHTSSQPWQQQPDNALKTLFNSSVTTFWHKETNDSEFDFMSQLNIYMDDEGFRFCDLMNLIENNLMNLIEKNLC